MNVLVTGATGGIGHALATEFAAHGAHVVATGRDVARGEGLVTDIRDNGGFAEFLPCDLSALEDIQSLIYQTTSNGNRVDALINNAAIAHFALTTNISGEDFEATFNVNVRAPILLVAAFAPLMAGRGQGAIVNVTSLAADRGLPIMGMYGASKASLASLTRAWATEFGPSGVRVNAVNPAMVIHENNHHLEELHHKNAARSPARSTGTAQDVADAVLYLAGPNTRHIHGIVLPVDGGLLASG